MNWQLLTQGISAGAGLASILFPPLAPFTLPLSMIAGTASNYIPPGGSKDYNKPKQLFGVDVTPSPSPSPSPQSNGLSAKNKAFDNENQSKLNTNNVNGPWMNNDINGPMYKPLGNGYLLNPTTVINPNQFININPNMSSTSPTDTTSTLGPKPFNNRNALLSRANSLVPTAKTNNDLDGFDQMQNQLANIDKQTTRANRYNIGAQSIGAVASIASIINELNKKPSQMLQSPEYSTVNLDSNQSAAINYAEDLTGKSKNAQLRMMLDLGIDPTLASTIVNNSANTQMLGAYANAENTRQSINTQQAQLNTNIQGQANQSLLQTRMFNIQKQMQENQMASANIGQSLMTLAGSVAGIGEGNFANFAGNQYMRNQVLSRI